MSEKLTCPICGQEIKGAPALSRTDNRTQICADCGTRQALAAIGVTNAEDVLARIHEYEAHKTQKEEKSNG